MEKKADFHSLSRKAKVQYVWDYYKWPIAAAIAALCFVIYLIYHYATSRDPLLNVIMMNCNDSITADSKGFDEFLEACGYDPKEDSVSLTSSLQFSDGEYSTSYNDTQVLTLMLAAGGQDLFFGTVHRIIRRTAGPLPGSSHLHDRGRCRRFLSLCDRAHRQCLASQVQLL